MMPFTHRRGFLAALAVFAILPARANAGRHGAPGRGVTMARHRPRP